MTSQTISLEGITNRVFEIRQQKEKEVEIPFQREIEEYLRLNKKPRVPFFSFGEARRKAKEEVKRYEEGIKAIQAKYQNHPLIQEWAKLQEQCPHDYGLWQEIDGPSEMRTCSICYHKQHRWNFSDLDGGCGLA